MSSPIRCEHCGAKYAEFRSGLTFADAKAEMYTGSPDPADWRSKSRRAVLGYMHERKRDLWAEYHGSGDCARESSAGDWEIVGASDWAVVLPF